MTLVRRYLPVATACIALLIPAGALSQSMSEAELRALEENLGQILEDGACEAQEDTIHELEIRVQEPSPLPTPLQAWSQIVASLVSRLTTPQ